MLWCHFSDTRAFTSAALTLHIQYLLIIIIDILKFIMIIGWFCDLCNPVWCSCKLHHTWSAVMHNSTAAMATAMAAVPQEGAWRTNAYEIWVTTWDITLNRCQHVTEHRLGIVDWPRWFQMNHTMFAITSIFPTHKGTLEIFHLIYITHNKLVCKIL